MVTLKRIVLLLTCMSVLACSAMQDEKPAVVETAPVVAPVVEPPVVVEHTPVAAPVTEQVVEQAPAVVETAPVAASVVDQPAAQEPKVEAIVVNPVVGAPVVEVVKEEAKSAEVVEQTPVAPEVKAPVAPEAKPAEAKSVVEQTPVISRWAKVGASCKSGFNTGAVWADCLRNGIVSVGAGMWNRTWHPVAQADKRSVAVFATYAALGAGYYYREGLKKGAGAVWSWAKASWSSLFSRGAAKSTLTLEVVNSDKMTAEALADANDKPILSAVLNLAVEKGDDAAIAKITAALKIVNAKK